MHATELHGLLLTLGDRGSRNCTAVKWGLHYDRGGSFGAPFFPVHAVEQHWLLVWLKQRLAPLVLYNHDYVMIAMAALVGLNLLKASLGRIYVGSLAWIGSSVTPTHVRQSLSHLNS